MQIAVIGAADATPEEYDTTRVFGSPYAEIVSEPMVELDHHLDTELPHQIHLPIGKSDHSLAEAQVGVGHLSI